MDRMVEEANFKSNDNEVIKHCASNDKDEAIINVSCSDSDPEEFFESNDTMERPIVVEPNEVRPEEETVNVPKIKWKVLKDKVQETPECKLVYDNDQELLHITGQDAGVKKNMIINLLQSINKGSLQLSSEQEKLLKSKDVQQLLETFFSIGIAYEFTQPAINMYGFGDIEGKLDNMKINFLKTCLVAVPEYVPKSKIRDCESHCSSIATVRVSFDELQSKLILTGFNEDITNVSNDIKKMFAEYEWKKGTFTLEGKDAVYVKAHAEDRLKREFKNADIIKTSNSNGKVSASYKCRQLSKKKLEEDLTIFRKSIVKTKVKLNEFDEEEMELMLMNLKKDISLLKDFETANTCCIFVEGNEVKEEIKMHKGDVEPPTESGKPDNQVVNEHPHDLYSNGQIKVLTLGTSKVQIIPDGNIIEDNSDLLVCGLHDSLNMMKMRVSTVFKRCDNSLQTEIKKFNFTENGVFVDKRTLPGTCCQGIAFVVLETWHQGMSDQKLIAGIIEVLDTANKMGFKSVSFPPLTNKYPNDMAAQAVACAIHTFVKTNPGSLSNIKSINLLVPDRLLFTEMVKAVDNMGCENGNDDHNAAEEEETTGVLASALGFSRFMTGVFSKSLIVLKNWLSKPGNQLMITIVHGGKDDISSRLKNEMKKNWLFVDYFRPGGTFCWPSWFIDFTTSSANTLNLITVKVKDSKTKHSVYKIKGRANDVQKMKDMMFQKVLEVGQDKLLFSSDSPNRGSVLFIEHAITCKKQFPSYWSLTWENFEFEQSNVSQLLLNVDQRMFKAIEKLVINAWDRNRVGAGYDAAYIPSGSSVKVISVQRLENPVLFSNYLGKRLSILRDMKRQQRLCKDVGLLQNSKGPVQTTVNLDESMKTEMLHEINEHYFFHGTKKRTVKQICEQGIDCRLSNPEAMFGQGVYSSESSTKADQYADDRNNRLPNGSELTMFLTRVVLGEVFLCDDEHKSVRDKRSTKLKRPPCLSCLSDVCIDNCNGTGQFYHSVMGDGKWMFREFVVYSNDQCYPEYLIKYQRV